MITSHYIWFYKIHLIIFTKTPLNFSFFYINKRSFTKTAMTEFEVKVYKIENLSCFLYEIDDETSAVLVLYRNLPIKIVNASIIIPDQFFLLEENSNYSIYSKKMILNTDKSLIESEIIPKINKNNVESLKEKINSQNALQIIFEKEKIKNQDFLYIYLSGENNFQGNILSYKIDRNLFNNFTPFETSSFLYKYERHIEQEIQQDGCYIKRHYFRICCYITIFLIFIMIYANIE